LYYTTANNPSIIIIHSNLSHHKLPILPNLLRDYSSECELHRRGALLPARIQYTPQHKRRRQMIHAQRSIQPSPHQFLDPLVNSLAAHLTVIETSLIGSWRDQALRYRDQRRLASSCLPTRRNGGPALNFDRYLQWVPYSTVQYSQLRDAESLLSARLNIQTLRFIVWYLFARGSVWNEAIWDMWYRLIHRYSSQVAGVPIYSTIHHPRYVYIALT